MITSVVHEEFEACHVREWDRLLQHVFDEETIKLIFQAGVGIIANELDKGIDSRYVVQKCNIHFEIEK